MEEEEQNLEKPPGILISTSDSKLQIPTDGIECPICLDVFSASKNPPTFLFLCPYSVNTNKQYTHGMCYKCFARLIFQTLHHSAYTLKCPSCRNTVSVEYAHVPTDFCDDEDEPNTLPRQLKRYKRIYMRKLSLVLHQHRQYRYAIMAIALLCINIVPPFAVGLAGYPSSLLDEVVRTSVSAHWFAPLSLSCGILGYYTGKGAARTLFQALRIVYSFLIQEEPSAIHSSRLVHQMATLVKKGLGFTLGFFACLLLPSIALNKLCIAPRKDIVKQFFVDAVSSCTTTVSDTVLRYFFREFDINQNERYVLTVYTSSLCTLCRVLLPSIGCFVMQHLYHLWHGKRKKISWENVKLL